MVANPSGFGSILGRAPLPRASCLTNAFGLGGLADVFRLPAFANHRVRLGESCLSIMVTITISTAIVIIIMISRLQKNAGPQTQCFLRFLSCFALVVVEAARLFFV